MQPPHQFFPPAHHPQHPQHVPGPGSPRLPFPPGAPLGYHGSGVQPLLPYQALPPFPAQGGLGMRGEPFGMPPPGQGYGHPPYGQGPPFPPQGPMPGHPEGHAGGALMAHPRHPGPAGPLGRGPGPQLGGGGGGRGPGRAWGPGPGSFRGGPRGGPPQSGGRGRGGRGGAGPSGMSGAGPGGRAGRWGQGDAQRRAPSTGHEPQRPQPGPAGRDQPGGGTTAPPTLSGRGTTDGGAGAAAPPAASAASVLRRGAGGTLTCQPCEREFTAEATLQAHLQTHEPCAEPGCSFSAPGRRLKEHKATVHGKVAPATSTRAIKAAQFRARESAEQVQRWLEERRRNFPSAANLERKAKEAEERKERGELPASDDAALRRKRIREVLEMQAALGLPMCEIPPHYLSDAGPSTRGGRGAARGWGAGPPSRGRGSLRGGRGRGMEQGPGGWQRGPGRGAGFGGRGGRMGRGARGGWGAGEWQGRGGEWQARGGGGGWDAVGLVASSSRRLEPPSAAAAPPAAAEGAQAPSAGDASADSGGSPELDGGAPLGSLSDLDGDAHVAEEEEHEHGEDWDEEDGQDGEDEEGAAEGDGDAGPGEGSAAGQALHHELVGLAGPASTGECAVLALGAAGARPEPTASELPQGSAQPLESPRGPAHSEALEECPVERTPQGGGAPAVPPVKRKREEAAPAPEEALEPGAAAPVAEEAVHSGSGCPASAGPAQAGPSPRPLCVFFQRGHCRRGQSCHFSHAAPPGAAPGQEGSSGREARGNAGAGQGKGGGGRGAEESGVEQMQDLEAWSPWERRPSLLARLLEKDVRREQSQSLQAIRFLVSNDFLLAYPYKPLTSLPWVAREASGAGEAPAP